MLGIVERGGHAMVDRATPNGVDDPYSDNVIGLCPTGALLSNDFLYKSRSWYLEPVRSVCTGCARGCSVNIWRRKKEWQLRLSGEERNREAYRITALPNPDINGPWICNKGFDLHKVLLRERVTNVRLGGVPASLDQAVDRARTLLAAGEVAGRHGLGSGFERRARRVCGVGQSTRPAPAHLCARRLSRRAR